MTSHGQPPFVPKQSGPQGRITRSQLSTTAEGFQVARRIDGDILAEACAHFNYHSYPHEIPSTPVGRATTRTLCETVGAQCPCARDQGARAGVPNG